MTPFASKLCTLLQCTPEELTSALKEANNNTLALAQIREGTLSSFNGKRVSFDGFTKNGAEHLYMGYMGISLHQVIYNRYGIRLRNPYCPCVISRDRTYDRVDYWPIELLDWQLTPTCKRFYSVRKQSLIF